METIDIALFFGLVLMIASFIILYRCARGKSRKRKIEELADSLVVVKDSFDYSLRRFDRLVDGMSEDNHKISFLKSRIIGLEDTVEELEHKRCELDAGITSLTDIHAELRESSTALAKKSSQIRKEIARDEQTILELEQQINSLKRIKDGLEIALYNSPAEEVPYLSMPICRMGLLPSAQSHLAAHGIQYAGDLVRLDEQYLTEIWGVGPATIERIRRRLNEHGASFGMDVIRVDNRWYRRKTD